METEANLTQETESVEVEAQVEEASQAEETVVAEPQTEPTEPEVTEPEAAAAEPQPEVAESADGVVVATEDVAPARSRMELARLAKESLIARAKEIADSTDWRKTSDEQRTLMEEWRKIGYAGKEINDKLWADFREARQAFFSRREEQVVGIKRQIIDEAKQLTENVGNWATTSSKLDDLMARWKKAGNSGSDSDKALWDEFNTIRREFRNRRKADLDKRRATAQANAQAKSEIVAEAKAIAESAEYTREHSDRMRQLDKDYKAIGFAGKPAN
ncbi:MAG: DUF349 domain-containing protein, partial [Atopobiaceae bacterium]|nr:DUF349 domain-containing protein [Atopobiaceae bacterium]